MQTLASMSHESCKTGTICVVHSGLLLPQMLFENQEVAASPLADIAEATGDNPQVSGRVELHHHCQYKYLLHLQVGCFLSQEHNIFRAIKGCVTRL